jgi:bis(5'-nucleosyl)-tetraphosphatase (symmetrical)
MATYAIGDIQGCYREFDQLLDVIDFNSDRDQLWLLGDLINRGQENLAVLKRVMSFGKSAVTVLGNHDLHFLAIHLGGHSINRSDTFADVLESKRVDEICDWYRQQPLLVADKKLGYVMTHAGIPHLWSLKQARSLAREVESVIQSDNCEPFFRDMYGNEPDLWQEDWEGMLRLRVITNYLTRMRLLDEQGRLNFSHKGSLSDAPGNLSPWYELRADEPLNATILFGHWAAIEGYTGQDKILALDTGCVWGRHLTAFCLDSGDYYTVNATS